jgi:hypothetical protein
MMGARFFFRHGQIFSELSLNMWLVCLPDDVTDAAAAVHQVDAHLHQFSSTSLRFISSTAASDGE